MVDTNVIISSLLKEGSIPDIVLMEICDDHELILCDYIIYECYEVAKKRFPQKVQLLDKLFANLRYELVSAPENGEVKIRDNKDQPIINAALAYKVDVLVTGDKHFLELDTEILKICTPAVYGDLFTLK